MQALEARVSLARYRISTALGLDDAADHFADAAEAARMAGYYAAQSGVIEMSAFIRDEPILRNAWKAGQEDYRFESTYCWYCEHSSLHCPTHG